MGTHITPTKVHTKAMVEGLIGVLLTIKVHGVIKLMFKVDNSNLERPLILLIKKELRSGKCQQSMGVKWSSTKASSRIPKDIYG